MPVIAIVGAGPGMGLAIARTFGSHGFSVALTARNPENLRTRVQELAGRGIKAVAFKGDARDEESIAAALCAAKAHFGRIDVLEFSPGEKSGPISGPSEVTRQSAQAQIDLYVHGAIATVRAVLPEMLDRGSGTILFTTCGSSIFPKPSSGNFGPGSAGPAMAWLRNWALALHSELYPRGVHVAHIAIDALVGRQPGADPDDIAPFYWNLYRHREAAEQVVLPLAQRTGRCA